MSASNSSHGASFWARTPGGWTSGTTSPQSSSSASTSALHTSQHHNNNNSAGLHLCYSSCSTHSCSPPPPTFSLMTQTSRQQPQSIPSTMHLQREDSQLAEQEQRPHAQCRQQTHYVHASDLIERARLIRHQPKNLSPVDASAHRSLLPARDPMYNGRKCLILDVDETLVHSSYEGTGRHDLHLKIPVDSEIVNVYVTFRPFLREFIEAIAPLFEVVIFTASMARYCNPLIDVIDECGLLGNVRLFRDHCSKVGETYVKDLSLLGRDLEQVAIIDNSPFAYLFQPRNAIPIPSWFDDPNDCELIRLVPVLEALAEAANVYEVLDNYNALLQLQRPRTVSMGR